MAEEIFNRNEEEKIDKAFDSKLMRRLLTYAKPYWKLFIVALLLLILATAADIVRPLLIQQAIDNNLNGYTKPMVVDSVSSGKKGIVFKDKVFERVDRISKETPESDIYSLIYIGESAYLVNGLLEKSSTATDIGNGQIKVVQSSATKMLPVQKLSSDEAKIFRAQDFRSIRNLALVFILIILAGFGFNFLQIFVLSYVGQTIIFNIRQQVFSHIQKMPVGFFDNNPVGRLVTRVTNDTETLNEMYTNVIITFLKDILILVGIAAVLMYMNLRLGLITVTFVPLIILLTILFRIKAKEVYRKVRGALAHVNSIFSENMTGMRIIQMFNKGKSKYEEFQKINHRYYKSVLSQIVVFGIFRPVIDMVGILCTSVIVWYGGRDLIHGSIEFGVLFAFITYTMQFFQPINDLAEKYDTLQSAMASSERIFTLLDVPEEQDEGKLILDNTNFKGEIEFKNVWFAYKDEDWVLKDVSFKIPPGKTFAIVGATGAGKTSIINLINRFYEIQRGVILIDGINILDIRKDSLRQNIGVVLQDVFLFSGNIKNNIRLNNKDITDTDIERVSQYVNAHHFISKLPSRYNEEVKERGVTFSSGQRQLIAFARVLAFNPAILVLDEATANIDTETELLIQDALDRITKDRTTIVIAHRLSTIQHADSIVVLHKGKIREMGTHQELLSQKGMYHHLYDLQYKNG